MPTYSRLCGIEKDSCLTRLSNVLVNGVPWRLYQDRFNNFYCDSYDGGLEIAKLNAKNYDEARKETIGLVNSYFN